MALFDIFTRPGRLLSAPVAAPTLQPVGSTSTFTKLVYSEFFAGEAGEVTRESALTIPALKKARDVIISVAASLPLVELDHGTPIEAPWLLNSRSGISPWHRIAYVVDDLFFYDWSALAVERDGFGQIIDALRIPFERWSVDPGGQILVDNQLVTDATSVVIIPGNGSGGVLTAGAPTIKGALALSRAWTGRAQNPIPVIELHQATDDELTDAEIDEVLAAWQSARLAPTGSVVFTSSKVEVHTHGEVRTDLFDAGRNAATLEIARLTGVPASILDGSQSTASLTYSTADGKRSEFDDYTLPMWLAPIEARLSLDDVSAPGRVIRFDHATRNTSIAPDLASPTKD